MLRNETKLTVASVPAIPAQLAPLEAQKASDAHINCHELLTKNQQVCRPLEPHNLSHPLTVKDQKRIITSCGTTALIPRFCNHSEEPAFFPHCSWTSDMNLERFSQPQPTFTSACPTSPQDML
jgi:hypothetical protein